MFFSNLLCAEQSDYYLPHIADGQYAGGSIRTTFLFFNNGGHAASVTMALTGDDGAPFDAMLSELGPGAISLSPWTREHPRSCRPMVRNRYEPEQPV